MDDYEVVAEELSQLAQRWRELERRVADVEKVNARLEDAALTTARALGEVHVTGTRCTTPCAVQTGSTNRSRPSATTMRLGSVAASQPARGFRVTAAYPAVSMLVHSPPGSRRRTSPQLGQRRSVASRTGSSPGALIADSTRDPQFGQASCSLPTSPGSGSFI